MTMQHPAHPRDERLAALAGADPEVLSDASLRAHVSACDRCSGMVDELGKLRSALAELPDLAPSRPIRLLPPAPAPSPAAGGLLGWVRRLAMPAVAAGAGLVLVGAIGLSGIGDMMQVGSGAPAAEDEAMDGGAAEPGAARETVAPAADDFESREASPTDAAHPAAEGDVAGEDEGDGERQEGERDVGLFSAGDGTDPWLAVTLVGVALLLAGLLARFAIRPRAV